MNRTNQADVGNAIVARLRADGKIPPGGEFVEVEHATAVCIRIVHADGSVTTHYDEMWSRSLDARVHADLASNLADAARTRANRLAGA